MQDILLLFISVETGSVLWENPAWKIEKTPLPLQSELPQYLHDEDVGLLIPPKNDVVEIELSPQHSEALETMKKKFEEMLKLEPDEKVWEIEYWSRYTTSGVIYGEHPDTIFLKFLRARSWNIDVAFNLMYEAVKWKSSFNITGVDTVSEEHVSNELKSGKAFVSGYDKEGRPILWFILRNHKKKNTDVEELKRFSVFLAELMRTKMRHPITTGTIVIDMKGVSIRDIDFEVIKFLIDVFSTKYPESLGSAYLVDSPRILAASWKMIAPLLDIRTREKFHFLTTPELPQSIDRSQIPTIFGGDSPFIARYSLSPK